MFAGNINPQVQQDDMQLQDSAADPLQQSLDMYIAQHEESMMQESVSGEQLNERQQTLDSPARHIGPREYI